MNVNTGLSWMSSSCGGLSECYKVQVQQNPPKCFRIHSIVYTRQIYHNFKIRKLSVKNVFCVYGLMSFRCKAGKCMVMTIHCGKYGWDDSSGIIMNTWPAIGLFSYEWNILSGLYLIYILSACLSLMLHFVSKWD